MQIDGRFGIKPDELTKVNSHSEHIMRKLYFYLYWSYLCCLHNDLLACRLSSKGPVMQIFKGKLSHDNEFPILLVCIPGIFLIDVSIKLKGHQSNSGVRVALL